ncbi:hypothetical protein GALMADRAFT_237781 [Galerina marginata CBS 339.88]|uniref:F-box domain-containing protein n=1 Tax=Galerina marginata (strain CBS 339.88) TaxID=685588 RepID=A0A067TRE9_GALM3|nr:hypothetical protein GALMADRAFT_237781 [Galerina marginata CBS 339.88]
MSMSTKETDTSSPSPASSDLFTVTRPTAGFPLGGDLLWHIFSMNADMEDKSEDKTPALSTLRHNSQVCLAWRNLIVNSPSLWGRIINFDWLHQEDWRKEVICRTGSSDLFIRGGITHKLSLIGDSVISILADNWPRVRSLELDFDDEHNSEIVEYGSDLWRLLKRSPDALESFKLTLTNLEEDPFILSPPDFTIFSNYAPSLRTFTAPSIQFNIRAPWVSSICHLSLTTPTPVHELLEVLAQMPLLETLEDCGVQAIIHGDPSQMRKVALPRLHHIIFNVKLNVTPYIAFLAQIEPLHGRVLWLYCNSFSYTDYDLGVQDINTISQVLSTYSRHAELSTSTTITLSIRRGVFQFFAQLPNGQSFNFILIYSTNLTERVGIELWNALRFPSVPHADCMGLYLHQSVPILPLSSKFTEIIAGAGSVTRLEATPQTLRLLLLLPGDLLKIAFPLVKTVVVKEWTRFTPGNDVEPLHDFLAFRSASGISISCLYVDITHGYLDLTSFEKFTGLKVVVSRYEEESDEYICGNGRPDALLFEEPPR